jgi:hypothetical protein
MFASYFRWFDFRFNIGPFLFNHWLGIVGTLFIAVYTPVFYVLKRRHPKGARTLLGIHSFGNLLAFMFVSVHFSHQLGRPPTAFPDLATGVPLYAAMILLTVTGLLQRFKVAGKRGRYWRFVHVSMAMSFYLIILVHVLHGFGVI